MLYWLNAAGATLAVLGWWQASDAITVRSQVPWTNVAVAGLILSGLGNALWLVAGRRAVYEAQKTLSPSLRHSPIATGEAMRPTEDERAVSAEGWTRYHRPDCILVRGKAVFSEPARRHLQAGRSPCGVCRP